MAQSLYQLRKLYSTAYVANQQIPIELTKYAQLDSFARIMVHVTGIITLAGSGGGTATGRDNPEDLLQFCNFTTSPVVAACNPYNQVSGRSLRIDRGLNYRCLKRFAPLSDTVSTAQTVDIWWELVFKRNRVRSAIEFDFDITRYTTANLTLQFGDWTRLFTGSSQQAAATSALNGCTIEIWGDSNFNVNPKAIHATEVFEQNFPITASQSDFLINQLPAGFLYTDLCILAEVNNALSDAVITNIDVEGGGNTWYRLGDNNGDMVKQMVSNDAFDGSVADPSDPDVSKAAQTTAGIYPIATFRDGMYSRQINALTQQFLMKIGVVYGGNPTNLRLFGRKLVPNAVYKAQPVATTTKK